MPNRNYNTPRISKDWADSRNTHDAVATAIHAIADSKRTPEDIWDAPTLAEWDHVKMAVAEYVAHGDYTAQPNGRYQWGDEVIIVD